MMKVTGHRAVERTKFAARADVRSSPRLRVSSSTRLLLACLSLLLAGKTLASGEDTNSLVVRPQETNSVVLIAVDTNSVVFSTLDTNTVALREARSTSALDLRSFKMIWERNIFDPNRSSRSATRARPPSDSTKPAKTEAFALVGTMSYEKGRFAFFESSSSQYQKVLETSNTIAGYIIADITPTHVKLQSTNGQPIELPVGMQMKKQDEGEWVLAGPVESRTSGRSSASSGSSGPEDREVLKRLLQKREQEGAPETSNTTDAVIISAEKTADEKKTEEKTEKVEKADTGAAGGANEVLKKLLQKREQEVNK